MEIASATLIWHTPHLGAPPDGMAEAGRTADFVSVSALDDGMAEVGRAAEGMPLARLKAGFSTRVAEVGRLCENGRVGLV